MDGATRSTLYGEQFLPIRTEQKEDVLCTYNYLIFNIIAYPLSEFHKLQEQKHGHSPNCPP